MRQRHQRRLVVDGRCQCIDRAVNAVRRRDNLDTVLRPKLAAKPLQDVEIRREVEIVGHDLVAIRLRLQGSQRQAIEVDRRRIGDDHLVGLRAHKLCDLAADATRNLNPALVPTADQPLAPLLFHKLVHALHCCLGQVDPASCRPDR